MAFLPLATQFFQSVDAEPKEGYGVNRARANMETKQGVEEDILPRQVSVMRAHVNWIDMVRMHACHDSGGSIEMAKCLPAVLLLDGGRELCFNGWLSGWSDLPVPFLPFFLSPQMHRPPSTGRLTLYAVSQSVHQHVRNPQQVQE